MTKRVIASVVEDNKREQAILAQGIHKIEQRNFNGPFNPYDPYENEKKSRAANRWKKHNLVYT